MGTNDALHEVHYYFPEEKMGCSTNTTISGSRTVTMGQDGGVPVDTGKGCLPGTPEWRKQRPLWSGVLNYFPKALLEVANVSWVGNEQHNPGEPLHWDRSKSTDEKDACARHLSEAGKFDSDGTRHSAKAAWRALANLEKELEADEQRMGDEVI